jgi:CTP synthase
MRNVCGIKDANSTEIDPSTHHPFIALVTEWTDKSGAKIVRTADTDLGGTMRLGAQSCLLTPGSLAQQAYGADSVVERHRHRYEVNEPLLNEFKDDHLVVSGRSEDGNLVEMIELDNHPWFVTCQFHPEFTSSPRDGHPLFTQFVKAALEQSQKKKIKKGSDKHETVNHCSDHITSDIAV